MSNIKLLWNNPITGKEEDTGLLIKPSVKFMPYSLYRITPNLFKLAIEAMDKCLYGEEASIIPLGRVKNCYVNLLWLEEFKYTLKGYNRSFDLRFVNRMGSSNIDKKEEAFFKANYKQLKKDLKFLMENVSKHNHSIESEIKSFDDIFMKLVFGVHWEKEVTGHLSISASEYEELTNHIVTKYYSDKTEDKTKFHSNIENSTVTKLSASDKQLLINQQKIYEGMLYNWIAEALWTSLKKHLQYDDKEEHFFRFLHNSKPYQTKINPDFNRPPMMSQRIFHGILIPRYIAYSNLKWNDFCTSALTNTEILSQIIALSNWYMYSYRTMVEENDALLKEDKFHTQSYNTIETSVEPDEYIPEMVDICDGKTGGITLDEIQNDYNEQLETKDFFSADESAQCDRNADEKNEVDMLPPRWLKIMQVTKTDNIDVAKEIIKKEIKPRKGIDTYKSLEVFLNGTSSMSEVAKEVGISKQSLSEAMNKVLSKFGLTIKDLTLK